jgi:hypothetical protein
VHEGNEFPFALRLDGDISQIRAGSSGSMIRCGGDRGLITQRATCIPHFLKTTTGLYKMKHALGRRIPLSCNKCLGLYIAVFDLAHDDVVRFE